MKTLFLLVALFVGTTSFSGLKNPDAVLGTWLAGEGKGHIQIYKQNGKYYGKIIWLRSPKESNGAAKVDSKNPNPDMRNRPIIGLVLLRDFVYKDGEWTEGFVYNTTDGNEYKAYMKLKNQNTLAVRGYVGFSCVDKTDTWTRIK